MADPGFLARGGVDPPRHNFAKFSQNCMKLGVARASKILLCRSANGYLQVLTGWEDTLSVVVLDADL